jgi:hypothetical protein
MRVVADFTDPYLIQKILGHIAAQPLPLKAAAFRVSTRLDEHTLKVYETL